VKPEDVRRLGDETWDAFNSGDFDRWIALVHSDFEGYSALVETEGGAAFKGIDGARAWWDNLRETFETVHISLEQVVAVGEHSLSVTWVRWVGKGSGIEMSQAVFFVNEVRDGRWMFVHSHLDPAAAFAELAQRLAQGASSPSQ
jgi:ketosteroid isomerase-like protein